MNENIIFCNNLNEEIQKLLGNSNFSKIFVISDHNTSQNCFSQLKILKNYSLVQELSIPPGDENKNIDTLKYLWEQLLIQNADRNSLIINLGGGVVTDIGAFVASTFKRGISFVNIPTSLMAMADAAIGGKCGININNFKNQVGNFAFPIATYIFTPFLETLPARHLIAGYAEMIKHSLLDNYRHWQKISSVIPSKIDFEYLGILLKESIQVKINYIKDDLHDKGIRQALNFGHTIGHAVETFFLNQNKDILHGEAVAIGIIAEIFLSNKITNFNFNYVFDIIGFISSHFPAYRITYNDYPIIFDILQKDKKNSDEKIIFSLLSDFGKVNLHQEVDKSVISEALNFYFQVKK